MKNICFLVDRAYPILVKSDNIQDVGGAEVQQCILAKALVQKGWMVSMLCYDYGQDDNIVVEGIRLIKTHSYDCVGIKFIRFLHPRITMLWRGMLKANADIYYSRAAGIRVGFSVLFCKIFKKKLIFAAASENDFVIGQQLYMGTLGEKICNWGIHHADCVFAQHERQQQLCREHFHREAVVVRNYCEIPTVQDEGNRNAILWVANLRPIKRPDIFIEIARKLSMYRFIMVGGAPGDGNTAEYYDNIVQQTKKVDNLTFHGFVHYSQIGQYYNCARIFINTSETEGFPNTFLEAWSRGVPTVSFFDSCAYYQGKKVGTVVESKEQLVEVIRKFMSDANAWHNASVLCKEYCEKNHFIGNHIDELENILMSC